jgi:hypothetical protein
MKVEYIEKIPDISADVNLLLTEFKKIEDKLTDVTDHGNAVLVQRKFHLMKGRKFTDDIKDMSYTKKIVHTLLQVSYFDSVNYRFIMPNTCYNWHFDKGQSCMHIPLITNEGCRFVYENHNFSMPSDGSVYMVNNGRLHTFINAGREPRLHLTFEILD